MPSPKKTVRETDLHEPVRDYLVARGYTVRSEVKKCDMVAQKGDGLIVVELKCRANLELLIQATERQRLTDSVYVAFPAPSDMSPRSRWRGIRRLLRQLELGALLVHLNGPVPRVEVAFHPLPYARRKKPAERRALIEEIGNRSGDFNQAGSTRVKLVTAYRENAIHIACCLDVLGELSPRQLRDMGTGDKTLSILNGNFYGWFARVSRGVYALSEEGASALETYADIAEPYRAQLKGIEPPSPAARRRKARGRK